MSYAELINSGRLQEAACRYRSDFNLIAQNPLTTDAQKETASNRLRDKFVQAYHSLFPEVTFVVPHRLFTHGAEDTEGHRAVWLAVNQVDQAETHFNGGYQAAAGASLTLLASGVTLGILVLSARGRRITSYYFDKMSLVLGSFFVMAGIGGLGSRFYHQFHKKNYDEVSLQECR